MTTADTTIADLSAAVSKGAADHLPPEVLEAFGAELGTLVANGVPTGVAVAGTPMPDGGLLDVEGNPTTLTAVRAGRPAVVVLYRGAWCPYCNVTLKTYQEKVVGELDARGIVLIAVSPQKPDGSLTMQQKHDLTYAVVSDPGNQVAHALGVVFTPGEATTAAQGQLGLDVAAGNADGSPELPMPTVVVVDAEGTIRWIDVHPNYTTRTEAAEILAAVEAL